MDTLELLVEKGKEITREYYQEEFRDSYVKVDMNEQIEKDVIGEAPAEIKSFVSSWLSTRAHDYGVRELCFFASVGLGAFPKQAYEEIIKKENLGFYVDQLFGKNKEFTDKELEEILKIARELEIPFASWPDYYHNCNIIIESSENDPVLGIPHPKIKIELSDGGKYMELERDINSVRIGEDIEDPSGIMDFRTNEVEITQSGVSKDEFEIATLIPFIHLTEIARKLGYLDGKI